MKLLPQKLDVWTELLNERWKLHSSIFNRFWQIHPCDGRTDGQTCGL